MKSGWNGKSRKFLLWGVIAVMPVLFPGCDNAPAPSEAGFYTYQGFRDWWRIPLQSPYQLTIIDSFTYGTLEKYDPTSSIADPRCEILVEDVTEAGYDRRFSVFRQSHQKKTYGILIYATGEIHRFAAKNELAQFINANYAGAQFPEMMPLEPFYQWRWRTIRNADGTE